MSHYKLLSCPIEIQIKIDPIPYSLVREDPLCEQLHSPSKHLLFKRNHSHPHLNLSIDIQSNPLPIKSPKTPSPARKIEFFNLQQFLIESNISEEMTLPAFLQTHPIQCLSKRAEQVQNPLETSGSSLESYPDLFSKKAQKLQSLSQKTSPQHLLKNNHELANQPNKINGFLLPFKPSTDTAHLLSLIGNRLSWSACGLGIFINITQLLHHPYKAPNNTLNCWHSSMHRLKSKQLGNLINILAYLSTMWSLSESKPSPKSLFTTYLLLTLASINTHLCTQHERQQLQQRARASCPQNKQHLPSDQQSALHDIQRQLQQHFNCQHQRLSQSSIANIAFGLGSCISALSQYHSPPILHTHLLINILTFIGVLLSLQISYLTLQRSRQQNRHHHTLTMNRHYHQLLNHIAKDQYPVPKAPLLLPPAMIQEQKNKIKAHMSLIKQYQAHLSQLKTPLNQYYPSLKHNILTLIQAHYDAMSDDTKWKFWQSALKPLAKHLKKDGYSTMTLGQLVNLNPTLINACFYTLMIPKTQTALKKLIQSDQHCLSAKAIKRHNQALIKAIQWQAKTPTQTLLKKIEHQLNHPHLPHIEALKHLLDSANIHCLTQLQNTQGPPITLFKKELLLKQLDLLN
ncbi:MAG: hypothetical protein CL521_01920 [Actinobacteria bacterium]|nr:hypothetical protein [Actinomycetota bacterium]